MRKSLIYGAAAVFALGAGALFLTERPLEVTVVAAETDVPLRIYGLGTVEARILSRVGFEVGATLETLAVDAGDSVRKGQELAVLHQGVGVGHGQGVVAGRDLQARRQLFYRLAGLATGHVDLRVGDNILDTVRSF